MMSFGRSAIPLAKDIVELFLGTLRDVTKEGAGLTAQGAKKAASLAANAIPGKGSEGRVGLKALVSENRELMSIPVEREDLKALKKQLKAYKVTFAVMEDPLTGGLSIHAKAQDYARIETALEGVLKDMTIDEAAQGRGEAPAGAPMPEAERGGRPAAPPRTSPAPATGAQAALIGSLNARGVVSDGELAAFEGAPTLDAADALLERHRDDDGFLDPDALDAPSEPERPWSEPQAALDGTAAPGEEPERALCSQAQREGGYTVKAYDNGHAEVIDARGQSVWSGYTVKGSIEASRRLAERGLKAYKDKERLSPPQEATASDRFEARLDKAEKTAAKEALEARPEPRRRDRVRENVRA